MSYRIPKYQPSREYVNSPGTVDAFSLDFGPKADVEHFVARAMEIVLSRATHAERPGFDFIEETLKSDVSIGDLRSENDLPNDVVTDHQLALVVADKCGYSAVELSNICRSDPADVEGWIRNFRNKIATRLCAAEGP
ncbi:MAG: hypothetical protein ABL308_13520 [Oceanicaulis sp.]